MDTQGARVFCQKVLETQPPSKEPFTVLKVPAMLMKAALRQSLEARGWGPPNFSAL